MLSPLGLLNRIDEISGFTHFRCMQPILPALRADFASLVDDWGVLSSHD